MSAHIATRCDECKSATVVAPLNILEPVWEQVLNLARLGRIAGWKMADADLSPFCVARRNAKEQAEAAAK